MPIHLSIYEQQYQLSSEDESKCSNITVTYLKEILRAIMLTVFEFQHSRPTTTETITKPLNDVPVA